jgi:hypothetical protein
MEEGMNLLLVFVVVGLTALMFYWLGSVQGRGSLASLSSVKWGRSYRVISKVASGSTFCVFLRDLTTAKVFAGCGNDFPGEKNDICYFDGKRWSISQSDRGNDVLPQTVHSSANLAESASP